MGRILFTVVVTIVVWYIVLTSAETYYVTPSPNTPCPEGVPCFTLSQYANKSINYFASNTTLILLPGNHSFGSKFSSRNISVVSVKSIESNSVSHSDTSITCYESARFIFESISVVSMRGLALFGCVNNKVTKVEEFTVEDCSFDSQGRDGTGLCLTHVSTANIMRTFFTSNTGQAAGGGIILYSSLDIIISDCIFQNNTATGIGGAVYAESSSNITIVNSILKNSMAKKGGGAVYAYISPNIIIVNSTLNNNTVTAGNNLQVGCREALFHSSQKSLKFTNTVTVNSTRNMNSKIGISGGGAVYAYSSPNFTIINSTLNSNCAKKLFIAGGAVSASSSPNFSIINSTLCSNTATGISAFGGAVYADDKSHNFTIVNSTLNKNTVTVTGDIFLVGGAHGGAVAIDNNSSNFSIVGSYLNSNMVNNSKVKTGGAVRYADSNPTVSDIDRSNVVFVADKGASGGAVYGYTSPNITIFNSTLNNNTVTMLVSDPNILVGGGAVHVSGGSAITTNGTLNSNTVTASTGVGGAIFSQDSSVVVYGYSNFINNHCSGSAIIYGIQSTLYFYGNTTVSNNNGSLFVYSCNVTFAGYTNIENNSVSFRSSATSVSDEGGALTAFQSEIFFMGKVKLKFNRAFKGGGIATIQSKLYFYGASIISHNTASMSGGGIYAYQSELNFKNHINITGNTAINKGGGIHAISSTARLTNGSETNIFENHAAMGGGLCLEGSAKVYVMKLFGEDSPSKRIVLSFDNNTADYGGAVYVADNTTSATCSATPFTDKVAIYDECFIQGIKLYRNTEFDTSSLKILNTQFTNNRAEESGNVLYGGLLDRCRVSPFAEIFYRYSNLTASSLSAVSYLLMITDFTVQDFKSTKMISSKPVRVCFCKDSQPDCSYYFDSIHVRKGENFKVSLVAVDHINNTIENSTVHAYVTQGAKLGEGQSSQNTREDRNCTDMIYSILSPRNSEKLYLYADGPCMNAGISTVNLTVVIEPCPIGFNDSRERCECDNKLYPEFISACSIDEETVQRKDNSWFSYVNTTSYQGYTYLLHKYCPFDYCKPPTKNFSVNLNLHNGANELCAHNRSGKLCGSCEDGLSLSLGSSHCKPCSNSWLALLIIFAIAGIVLVAIILKLNFTVADGTFNGLIFYANIFVANRAVFFPHDGTKILTVFIAWLNLDLGIETCFYDGMDGYTKTWMQFVFPLYVISLVAAIIIISDYSTRFAKLFRGKNPIATLATLILLSYTKLLRAIIDSLSVTTLQYSDGSHELVWLIDANISYLRGKHIPLFITALIAAIVLLGFTLILFAWQWLVYCPNKGPLRWIIGNTKIISMIDAYHNPYNKDHRYWIGLLLLVRVVLYLESAVNVFGDPQINLLSIILAIVIIHFLKQVVESKRKVTGMENGHNSMSESKLSKILLIRKVHKHQHVEILEAVSFLNLLILASVTFLTVNKDVDSQNVIACISTGIAFVTFLALFGYHVYKFVLTEIFHKFSSKLNTQRRPHTPLPVNNTVSAALDNTEGSRAETETEVNASPKNLLTKTLEDDQDQQLITAEGGASAQTSRVRKKLSLTKSSSSCPVSQDTSIEIEVPNLASGQRPSLLSPSVVVGMSLREEERSSGSEDEYTPLLKQE